MNVDDKLGLLAGLWITHMHRDNGLVNVSLVEVDVSDPHGQYEMNASEESHWSNRIRDIFMQFTFFTVDTFSNTTL